MTTRRATDNTKALDAFMTTKFQIDAILERLKALSDDHLPEGPERRPLQDQPRRDQLGLRRHPEPLRQPPARGYPSCVQGG